MSWGPALLIVAPLFLLTLGAFSETWDSQGPRGFTLNAFSQAWSVSAKSAVFSLWIAATAALISMSLAIPAAYLLNQEGSVIARVLRPLCSLPVVLPSLMLAMGLILALPALQGGWELLLIAFVAQCLPFAIWPIATSLQLLDVGLLETAGRTLGASPTQRFFWLVLPNIIRPAAVGGLTVFVLVLAESSTSFFLASGEYQPFGITLYNAFQDLDIRVAAATTLILIAMLTPAVITLEVWSARSVRRKGGLNSELSTHSGASASAATQSMA